MPKKMRRGDEFARAVSFRNQEKIVTVVEWVRIGKTYAAPDGKRYCQAFSANGEHFDECAVLRDALTKNGFARLADRGKE